MPTQAIMRHTVTTVFTFTGTPAEGTRKAMSAAGYQFDRRSKQWYRQDQSIDLVTEEQVARDIGVPA